MNGWNKNCEYGRTDCMPCTHCDAYIPTMTNADRIRAMTDEELAKWLCDISLCECCEWASAWSGCQVRDWLQQPCGGTDNGTA